MHAIRALFGAAWPKAVLFDLDGTLVDSALDLALAVDGMLTELGRAPAGEAQVRRWIGNGAAMLVHRALTGGLDDHPLDAAMHAQALEVFRRHYARCNGLASRVYADVPAVLARLQHEGCRLAVVTNKPLDFAEPLLEGLALRTAFEVVIGGECLPARKPDPMPLLHVVEAFGLEPATVLMVGDSAHDVRAARAAGMPVIGRRGGYNHGRDIAELAPDLVFDDYREWLQ